MDNYFIKKIIKAESLKQAVRCEGKGKIVEVWAEQPPETQKNILTPAIGFTINEETRSGSQARF